MYPPRVRASYTYDQNPDLHDGTGDVFENKHLALFCQREQILMPEAMELAMELPNGCFLAGGFMESYINGRKPKDFDVFFCGANELFAFLRRAQNAPTGTYLHGYQQEKSLNDFAASQDKYIRLVHPNPAKPPIQLVRIRWYENASQVLDTFDFSACQFALANTLELTYGTNALTDARGLHLRVRRIIFRLSTAARIKRWTETKGYSFVASRQCDEYSRDSLFEELAEHVAEGSPEAAAAAGSFY